MGYGKRKIVKSSVLTGQENGALDLGILVTLKPLPGVGGSDVRLIPPAARGFAALRDTAYALGHKLKPTSAGDSYRSYAQQKSTFLDRYVRKNLPGRPSKTWNGERWYQKPGTAMAAVPGTSNHGWAAAIDVGEENDGDLATDPLDNATLRWLLDNEERFGFFHGVQSEPWHLEWYPGDSIPAAVLEWERSRKNRTGDDEMPKAIQTTKGYFVCQGGYRELIADGDDMAKVIAVYGQVSWPTADGNGFPTPIIDAPVARGGLGWTWDEIDRILGRDRAAPKV